MRREGRRQFLQGGLGLAGAGLLAGCGLVPARYLWGSGPRHIGYLGAGSLTSSEPMLAGFRTGMAALGYVEGQDVVFEARYADGRVDALPALAAELVALPVDVILTDGDVPMIPAQQATKTIPVVFTQANDPVADGYVASMARPGGNLTGLTGLAAQEEAKRLQLLTEVAPSMARVAVLWPGLQVARFRQIEDAGPALGLQILSLTLNRPDDLEATLTSAIVWHTDGLIVIGAGGIMGPMIPRIVKVAAQNVRTWARDVRDAAINFREQSVKLCALYHKSITAQLVGGFVSLSNEPTYIYRR